MRETLRRPSTSAAHGTLLLHGLDEVGRFATSTIQRGHCGREGAATLCRLLELLGNRVPCARLTYRGKQALGSIRAHSQSTQSWQAHILIDLKRAEELEVLWRLVEGTDALLQNLRLGVAERLSIGYEQVRAHEPDIVYLSVSAFGYGGEWQYRPPLRPAGHCDFLHRNDRQRAGLDGLMWLGLY